MFTFLVHTKSTVSAYRIYCSYSRGSQWQRNISFRESHRQDTINLSPCRMLAQDSGIFAHLLNLSSILYLKYLKFQKQFSAITEKPSPNPPWAHKNHTVVVLCFKNLLGIIMDYVTKV